MNIESCVYFDVSFVFLKNLDDCYTIIQCKIELNVFIPCIEFGISPETKKLMRQRDNTRENIKKAQNGDKIVFIEKYKKLRNSVNYQIKKENIKHNENRVDMAKSNSELWKIVNEVVKPRKENEWTIKTDENSVTSDPQEVANIFNTFSRFNL